MVKIGGKMVDLVFGCPLKNTYIMKGLYIAPNSPKWVNVIKKLLPFGFIPEGFEDPAGSDDSQPDITIRNSKGIKAGVEVKLEEGAAFGSGTLQFDVTAVLVTGKDPWYIAEVDQFGNELKESQDLMIDHAFFKMNLRRIYTIAFSDNLCKMTERVFGFKREGVLREHQFSNGKYVDSYVLGLLRSDWKK